MNHDEMKKAEYQFSEKGIEIKEISRSCLF